MFGISYATWKEICEMYFSIHINTHKAYLQWFPFSKLTDEDKREISGENFFNTYIKTGGFTFFPEVMRCSENYIQKSDGSFRHASLISPILFLVIQSVGKEIDKRYKSQRPIDVDVYYAGNYKENRSIYKHDYDEFFKEINVGKRNYKYFIKTDIASFFGSINVNNLIERIDAICNEDIQKISQKTLLLLKELLLYTGDGYFPLIENSVASSYFATIIYLDDIDCELYKFIDDKIKDVSSFHMVRYVDDLYILFNSEKNIDDLTYVYNAVRNRYSSILKKYGLALNTKKCVLKEMAKINDELKKSLYNEYVHGEEYDIGESFTGKLIGFLKEIYQNVCRHGMTNELYKSLIEKHFTIDGIEFTPEEVFNYLIYENQKELKQPDVSKIMMQIIKEDISFLSIDPKRLSVMVMQSYDNSRPVKEMLNQLFRRSRLGLWNSYDTTIAITYLIQSKFQHRDLLKIIEEKCPDLYLYYNYACRISFINQLSNEKCNIYLRCIANDIKSTFLFFMSICENKRRNYLSGYAYYKNYFDRISADMAYISNEEPNSRKPNYKKYYKEKAFISLYSKIDNSCKIIKEAHKLRNANPLSHSSADLLDNNGSSKELLIMQTKLDGLISSYAISNKL